MPTQESPEDGVQVVGELRITLAVWHATGYAGTQTWAWTMAHALRDLGHQVNLLVTQRREMAMRLISAGFEVYSTDDTLPACDLVIASQPRMFQLCPVCGSSFVPDDKMMLPAHTKPYSKTACLGSLMKGKDALPKAKRLYVCHGWLPHEKPLLDGTPYVSVSQEVANNLKSEYDVGAKVVGQPVQLERFRSIKPIRDKNPVALVLSSWPASQEQVEAACLEAGVSIYELPTQGGCWNMPHRINEVDIVIGTGRGIVEAMACGRVACICGKFGCDGLVTPAVVEQQVQYNFSGRWLKGELPKTLTEALKGYDSVLGKWGRIDAETRFQPLAAAQALVEAA